MTTAQIHKLLATGLPAGSQQPELIETHISWVLLCNGFAYKIKKPVHYSFIDFSTLSRRKYFCEKEIELNQRLTNNIYLDVQPVKEWHDTYRIGGTEGAVLDYAVRMRQVDRNKQMDVLLQEGKVTPADIQGLAKKVAAFHNTAIIIYPKDLQDVQKKFKDLEQEKDYLSQQLQGSSTPLIQQAVEVSEVFMKKNEDLLSQRCREGFFRDCHGDLHSRNIFLLPDPQPFDCIEFNDELRQIDVLNEVAFLCMDLEAFDRHDLSKLFFSCYNHWFPAAKTNEEYRLFVYYKSYRANIRAKVNSLRARSAANEAQKTVALQEACKYLYLMNNYIQTLKAQ